MGSPKSSRWSPWSPNCCRRRGARTPACSVHTHVNAFSLARVERPALLGPARIRREGPIGQEREHDLGAVERLIDFVGPTVTALQSLLIEPHIEAAGLQICLLYTSPS